MKILKKVTMITACAAMAGLASATLAVNASADELTPDTAVVYNEPVIVSDTNYMPEAADEPATVPDNSDVVPEISEKSASDSDSGSVPDSAVSDELAYIHDKAIEEIYSVIKFDTCYDSYMPGTQIVETNVVNPNNNGVYWNGTSFIEITSTECIFFKVDTNGYNDVCGRTSIYSIGTTGTTFTASFKEGEWYYYDDNDNVVRPKNKTLDVTGSHSGKTITVNGVTYTK